VLRLQRQRHALCVWVVPQQHLWHLGALHGVLGRGVVSDAVPGWRQRASEQSPSLPVLLLLLLLLLLPPSCTPPTWQSSEADASMLPS
jgi:hypothetical protein